MLSERRAIGEDRFAELVIWRLPQPAPGSTHSYKYRLAFVVAEQCVLRFDNESGKGDHKHIREIEVPYVFTSLPQLIEDFLQEIASWRSDEQR